MLCRVYGRYQRAGFLGLGSAGLRELQLGRFLYCLLGQRHVCDRDLGAMCLMWALRTSICIFYYAIILYTCHVIHDHEMYGYSVRCRLLFSFHTLVSLSLLICLLSLVTHFCFSSFQVRARLNIGGRLVVFELCRQVVYRAVLFWCVYFVMLCHRHLVFEYLARFCICAFICHVTL